MKRIIKEYQFKFTASVILLPLLFVFTMWLVFWIEMKFKVNFHHYGIYPREWFGFKGILLSPFLHSDFQHITNNSLALLVLLALLQYFYKAQTFAVVFLGILFSGLGTWLLGRPSYHIGASGLIYVLVSFIFFKGIFTKYYRLMAVSFVVVLLYGGMVWYMFPETGQSISWEGHLSGFITGLFMALVIKTPQFGKPLMYEWEHPDFNPDNDKFMRNFDENGNFNPPPKVVMPEEEDSVKSYFTSSIKVIYDYLGLKKERR